MKASSDADMLDWLSAIRTAISKAEEKAAVSVVSTASEGRESGELSGSEGGWLEMLNAGQDKGLSCFSTWWFIVDSKSLRYFKNKSETNAKDCLGLIRLRGCKVKKRKKNKEKAAVDPFRTLTFKIFNKSGASLYSTTRPDGLPFNATVFRTQTDKCILRAGSEETLAKWVKAIEKGIKLASKTSGLAQMAMSLSATPPLPNNALPSPRRRPSQDLSTDSFTLNSDDASFSSITSDASFSSTSTIQPSAASSASSSPTSSPSSSYILQKDPTQKHQQPQQESPKQQHKQKEDEKTAKTNSLNELQTDSIPTTTISAFASSTPAPQTTTASSAATSTSLAPPSSASSSSNPSSPNFPSASSSSPSSSSAASGNQENAFHSFAVENRNRLMQSEWLQCEWFNIILERDFADMQQSTVFKEGLARRLQRKFDAKKKRPAYLGPIKISNIDVGSSFLRVQKIKLLRGCLENEVIGEALLDYNGGFSVSVSTEVYINWPRDRFATIPMKITLTISRISGKLHIYGPPKLMERFRASFAEMPETDIGVRVEIGEKYRQVNWLPKVDKYLVTTLKKFVRDRLVYPNRMTFFLPFPGRKFSLKTENVTKPKKPKPPASASADASSPSAAPSTSTAGSSSSSAPSSSATPARTLSSVDPDLESKKLYLMSFFDAINTGQLKNLSVLFAPNVKLMGLSSRSIPDKTKQEQGFKALLNCIKHLHQVFEGLSFSIQMVEHIPKQNGQLWCRWKLRGLWRYSFMGLAPSQEQVEFGGMSFFTFAMQQSQQPQPEREEAGNEDEAAHLRVTVYEEEWNFVDVMHHHHHHQTHGRGGGGGAEDASSPQTS
ncbi:ERMES complex subunit mmm1 [Balamuthia mandrillaris]